jgi:riboflavin kinase/FMN adenylyltransferase
MNVVHAAKDLEVKSQKVCLAIGVFDGVHLGHQQIIRQTIADARQQGRLALVVTFDRHPSQIVAPDRVPPFVYSPAQKLRTIKSLGVDALLEIPFDKEFSEKSGPQFIQELDSDLGGIASICVGADFVFGCKRSGNVSVLKELGDQLGFHVHGLAAVALDGQVVSSTRIREAIRQGQLDAASQMLGRPYAIEGRVMTGDQLGRRWGFPTANLEVSGLVLPPHGVYAGVAAVDNKIWRVALNIGLRPTVASVNPVLRVEAHLLDFQGDLHGQPLEIVIGRKLREETKFDSVEALVKQIREDVAMVRTQA